MDKQSILFDGQEPLQRLGTSGVPPTVLHPTVNSKTSLLLLASIHQSLIEWTQHFQCNFNRQHRGIPWVFIILSTLILTSLAFAGDTDLDGVDDLIDLDDDNDGILDSTENFKQIFSYTGSDQLATVPANAVGM